MYFFIDNVIAKKVYLEISMQSVLLSNCFANISNLTHFSLKSEKLCRQHKIDNKLDIPKRRRVYYITLSVNASRKMRTNEKYCCFSEFD